MTDIEFENFVKGTIARV